MEPPDDSLPPEIRRFAPWIWQPMDMLGVGMTIGAVGSALGLVLWYVTQWLGHW